MNTKKVMAWDQQQFLPSFDQLYKMYQEVHHLFTFMHHQSSHCYFVTEQQEKGGVPNINMEPLLERVVKTDCHFCPSKPEQGAMRVSIDGCMSLKQAPRAYFDVRTPWNKFLYPPMTSQLKDLLTTKSKNPATCSSSFTCEPSSTSTVSIDPTKQQIMGVVTVICDHNIHTVSVDIKKYGGRGGGEKYCYALFVLDHIMHQLPGVKFYVSYDLGCAFLKYAKKNLNPERYKEIIAFIIPSMHVWGHQLKCQVLYSPSRTDGSGTHSYENIEQNWSKYSGLVTSIRGMSEANRVDFISSSAEKFARKAVEAMLDNLQKGYDKAVELVVFLRKELDQVLFEESIQESEVDGFIISLKNLFEGTDSAGKNADKSADKSADYAEAIDAVVSLMQSCDEAESVHSENGSDVGDDASQVSDELFGAKLADSKLAENYLKSIIEQRVAEGKPLWEFDVDGCRHPDYLALQFNQTVVLNEKNALKFRLCQLYYAHKDQFRKAQRKVGVTTARKLFDSARKLRVEYLACLEKFNDKYHKTCAITIKDLANPDSKFRSSEDDLGTRAQKRVVDSYSRWKRALEEVGYKRNAHRNFIVNATAQSERLQEELILRNKFQGGDQQIVKEGQMWLISRRLLMYQRHIRSASSCRLE